MPAALLRRILVCLAIAVVALAVHRQDVVPTVRAPFRRSRTLEPARSGSTI